MAWIVDPSTQVELWVPDFATPEDVIQREAIRRQGRLGTIRMFPELGAEWPLWDAETLVIEPVVETLSADLRAGLRRWNNVWLESYDHDRGWVSVRIRDAWCAEGEALAARVARQVWDFAEVLPVFEMYSRVASD